VRARGPRGCRYSTIPSSSPKARRADTGKDWPRISPKRRNTRLTLLELWPLPDQRLDSLPLIEVVQQVETAVDALRPDLVCTHFPRRRERRSRGRGPSCLACMPYVLPALRRFAVFETPSSTGWAWSADSPFTPSPYVDVTDTLDAKLEAMSCHETELCDPPHPRSLRALRDRAGYWGSRGARPWSRSRCCGRLPVLLVPMALVAAFVRCTSRGPAL
jgi:hypothetical protein